MAALILEVVTRGLHRYFPLDGEVTTIGRALDNDIILSDPTVAPHHLKIIRYGDDSIELVNLSDVNPTQVGQRRVDSLVATELPLQIELGRVHAQLRRRDQAVAPTRAIAGRDGNGNPLFGRLYWAVLLACACLFVGGLEFWLNAYNEYQWSDLFKYLLREPLLSIGGFVLALAVLERLLVNRWEIRQMITSVCLVYLLYYAIGTLAGLLDYLFSSGWPGTLLYLLWFFLLIPGAIALYLVHISHLHRRRALLLAMLIASPIVLPALMQSPKLLLLLEDFSSAARYQNSLSSINWHLRTTVSIDDFVREARELDPGEFAD